MRRTRHIDWEAVLALFLLAWLLVVALAGLVTYPIVQGS